MAGGDGSLAVVAVAARAYGLPSSAFPPAPATTSRSISVSIDMTSSARWTRSATGRVERSIDVAEVNGRVFLNNVSLGIGEAVQRPPTVTRRCDPAGDDRGGSRPSRAAPEVRLVDDLGREHRHPAVVLVSNNPYALDRPVAPGTRPRLDGGELGIVVLDRPRPSADPPARVWSATRLAVDATAPVHAGIDGEAVELDAPLAFVTRPGALRVRISSRHPGVSPSGRLP